MEPPLTSRQWQARVLEVRRRALQERKRMWPEGTVSLCPLCKEARLCSRRDLTREVHGRGVVLVFANLHGAACDGCGAEFLEGYEQIAVEDRSGAPYHAPIAGSVTSLGGNKLGTYWPKDVAAALGLHARDALEMTPLAPDTVVIRVVHTHAPCGHAQGKPVP